MRYAIIKNIVVFTFVVAISVNAFASQKTDADTDTIIPKMEGVEIFGPAKIDKATYEIKANALRENINSISSQIKDFNDYKEDVLIKANTYISNNLDSERISKVKELVKLIQADSKREKKISVNSSIQNYVKNEEYSKALSKLNNTYEDKQRQLDHIEEVKNILRQISSLIE